MKPKKASGVNVTEAQRGTVAVKLRLPPEVAEALDERAERWGLTRSGTVARLLEEWEFAKRHLEQWAGQHKGKSDE